MPWITAGATVLGGMLGGKGSKGQKQTLQVPQSNVAFSQLQPNAAALPMYGWMAGNANQLMQTPAPYFPGQTYVSPSALTQQGVEMQKGLLGSAEGNYNFLSGAADVANNPYVQAMMQQNSVGATDWLMNQAMPLISKNSQAVNALGSSRQGLAEGTALAQAQKNLLAQNAATQMQAYSQGLGAQQSALGQTGALMGNALMPGQTVEGYQNAALQDQINRFNYTFQEPYQRMGSVQNWMQALAPIGVQQSGGSSVSTQQNPNYMSPMQGILGGASLGGSFGAALAPMFQQKQPLTGSAAAGRPAL